MGFFSTIEIGAGIGIHVPHPAAAATRSRSSTRGRTKDDFLMVAAAAAAAAAAEDERGRWRLPSNPFPLLRRRTTPPRRRFLISPAAGAASDCDQFSERTSPDEVREEIRRCYQLIHKLGRGVIYLGSSRVNAEHPHYLQALELAREVAKLLDCTTWSGAGPGLMDAAFKGAFEANKPVGGFKIARESGEWTSSNFHPYLPPETYLTCRFFSARKHALVDAVVRNDPSDMTAVVAFPGGIGTLDEMFEILALIQLERIGSKLPVPFLLMNYESYYSKLLDFLQECEMWGTVARGEVESLWKVCDGNFEALEYLSDFYNLPQRKRNYDINIDKGQEILH